MTCLIKVREVDAYSPLSIFLFHNDWVSDLVRIPNFHYGSNFEKLFYFVVDRASALGSQLSSLLLDRFEIRVDVELVALDVDINPWHVLCGPCERVQVLFQASNKLNFKRLAQVRADFDTAVWECFV